MATQKAIVLLLFVFMGAAAMQGVRAQERGGWQGGSPGGGPSGPSNGQVRGVVQDATTGTPIEMATVAVWNAVDSTLATGAVTTADGVFEIEGLRPGRYSLKVSFIGYGTAPVYGVVVTPQSPRFDAGVIRLTEDTAALGEVEVSAERDFMEVRIDRTIYNTKDQIVSDGGSASDVLRNIPSVEVDMEGRISLRGNQNVAVLINGRPSQMTGDMLASFLQGLPASTVERIEVIPNPSARYDPDGMSGILNIVLKQRVETGLSGALTAGGGTRGEYNASGMVGYNRGALNARLNYGLRKGTREREGERYNEFRFATPYAYLETLSTGSREIFAHTFNGNVDYRLGEHNALSLSGLLSTRDVQGDDLNAYSEWVADLAERTRYDRTSLETGAALNMNVGLAFRRVLDPSRHEFVAEAQYDNGWDDEDQEYRQELLRPDADPVLTELERSELGERTGSTTLQVDYVRPLGKDGKLETGYKGTLQQLDSDIFSERFDLATGAFAPDSELDNTFTFDEQVHAGYGTIGQQFGAVGVQAGVRLEQALTTFYLSSTSTSYENDYFSIFPSAYLTYKLGEVHQLRASYSKRINRPRVSGWFNQLNPISDRSDPHFRRVGNPYLKPEYIHSTELTYTLTTKRTMLSVSPYYRRTVDVIRFLNEVDAQGVTTLTFKNLDMSESWGAEVISTLRFGERLNGFASFDLYRVATDGSSVEASLSNDAYGWSTRLNGTVKLTGTLSTQLSLFYRAPMDVEQGRMGSMTRSDIAFRQQLFGKRASLSVRVEDPFALAGFNMTRDTPTFYFENVNRWHARALNLSFTYNFGQQDRNMARRQGPPREQGGADMPDMGF